MHSSLRPAIRGLLSEWRQPDDILVPIGPAGHLKGIEFIAQQFIKIEADAKPHHPGESSNYNV